MWGKLILDPYAHRYKNQFEMNHRPKLRDKTIKLLQENMGEYLHDLGLEEGFLNRTQKSSS